MSNKPIANTDTPDPWLLAHNNKFYLTFTLGNRIEIWSSSSLEDFHSASKSTVWHPPPQSAWSADLWAPELHFIRGVWYIYFCGAPPNVGNPGYRTLVLRSRGVDPMVVDGWEFLGEVKGMRGDQWSIDATVFSLPSSVSGGAGRGMQGQSYGQDYGQDQRGATDSTELYMCYSGWPLGDHSDTQQDLFLVKMKDPETVDPNTLVCISHASLNWERPDNGRRGVNEGPTFLSLPDGSFTGIVYSAHGSWTNQYKLGLLALVNPSQPLDPRSWYKRPTPLLVSNEARGGPFGPGHASFVHSPHNDGRVYCVYHGTERADEGWANRKARVMSLGFECFRADAMAVCCADSRGGGQTVDGGEPVGYNTGGGGGFPGLQQQHMNQNQSQYQHQQQQQQQQQQSMGNASGGFGDRIGKEFEKRIPGQYRGAYDKMRKFLS